MNDFMTADDSWAWCPGSGGKERWVWHEHKGLDRWLTVGAAASGSV